MERKIPRLEAMTDTEAVMFYCKEALRLVKKRHWDAEDRAYYERLLAWKKRLNQRLKKNRLKMWQEDA